MIAEQLEFQISQYVDGTLSVAERLMVDKALQADPHARQLLADYRRLNVQLSRAHAGPSIHWDRFAEHLSVHIADEYDAPNAPIIAGRIGNWGSRLKIAAAILIAGTAWIVVRHTHPVAPTTVVNVPESTSIVSGPRPEMASGPAVTEVSVAPSAVARAKSNGDGVAANPQPKVQIFGLTPPASRASHLH